MEHLAASGPNLKGATQLQLDLLEVPDDFLPHIQKASSVLIHWEVRISGLAVPFSLWIIQ